MPVLWCSYFDDKQQFHVLWSVSKKSLWRSFIKQYKPLWNWWDPNKRHALLGRGLLSQPMRGQLLLLRTNGNQAFCSAIWQLKWNLSGLVGAILTDFRPIRSRKTSPEGSCCQLLFTFCLLVVHVICSATDRKSKPNLDGLNRRELKLNVRQTKYCHGSGLRWKCAACSTFCG